jgi:hypothetical protein
MMSRDEFARAIQSFLEELSAIAVTKNPEDLKHLLGFDAELREAREIFQDRRTPANVIVSTAVGLIDEFAHRSWDEIVDKAYAFYIDQSTSSTEKARRPERS